MITVPVKTATAAQLAEYAQTHLGLAGVYYTLGRDKILEVMQGVGFDSENIEVSGDPAPARRTKSTPADDPDRMVRITIASAEGAGGNRPIPVAVNGVGMLVPRGKPVELPWKYLHALQNAVANHAELDENGEIIAWRESPAFPISVHSL